MYSTYNAFASGESHAGISLTFDFFAFVVLRHRTVVFVNPENVKSAVYRVKLDDATFENETQTLQQTLGEWL